jgi:putative lipoprotein
MLEPTVLSRNGVAARHAFRCSRRVVQAGVLVAIAATLLACGGAGGDQNAGAVGDTTRLLGTVTYREKAALPSDATVEVRLEESANGSPPVTVDMETFDAGGRQVPIPFTLEFSRDLLKTQHTYALRAAIRSKSGDVLYASADAEQLSSPNTTARIDLVVQPVAASAAPH